jgi:hypothetical protein
MNEQDLFVKVRLDLLALGVKPRLLDLYGRLQLYAGKAKTCYPKHSTLAREVGLRTERQIWNLLDQLRQLHLVEWKRGRYFNTYRVLDPDRKWISGQIGNGFPFSDRKRISDRKESSSKEVFKRSPPPTPSPSEGGDAPRVERRQQPGASSREWRAGPQKEKHLDDDETKLQPPAQPLTPEEQFRQILRERHGAQFNADRCAQNVKRQLAKSMIGLSMANFLSYDAERTTAPQKLTNPNGHYVALAKELVEAAPPAGPFLQQLIDRAAANAPPEPERDERGRCKLCSGPGRLADGAFCTCAIGRDLERLERRAAQAQVTKKTPAATGAKGNPNVVNIKSHGS